MSTNYDAILLVSFGGPETREDVLPFLRNVVRGKPVPEERILEVAEHYYHFGGKSPINQQNRDLIASIERELAEHGPQLPIYWGNRNWDPLLADTLARMKADGVGRALAFVTSTFSSYSGCRQYREDIARAQAQVGEGAPEVDKLRVFFNHPGFIEALADNVRAALMRLPEGAREGAKVIYTAHSIPVSMAQSSPYVAQLEESCRLVSEALGRTGDTLVYQSRSGSPTQPWLGPDILDYLREVKSAPQPPTVAEAAVTPPDPPTVAEIAVTPPDPPILGQQMHSRDVAAEAHTDRPAVVIAPIGFVSDHMEVLYDLDTEARDLCTELGLPMERAATPGTHPAFVRMIRQLIQERTDGGPVLSLGTLGPSHDVCAADCCPAPRRPGA